MIEEVSTYVISISEIDKFHPNKSLNQDDNKGFKKSKSYEELKDNLKTSSSVSTFIHQGDEKKQNERRKSFGLMDTRIYDISDYDRDMYDKITPYFNGKFPIHFIAWRENLLEEDILRLVKKNPNVLVFYC